MRNNIAKRIQRPNRQKRTNFEPKQGRGQIQTIEERCECLQYQNHITSSHRWLQSIDLRDAAYEFKYFAGGRQLSKETLLFDKTTIFWHSVVVIKRNSKYTWSKLKSMHDAWQKFLTKAKSAEVFSKYSYKTQTSFLFFLIFF